MDIAVIVQLSTKLANVMNKSNKGIVIKNNNDEFVIDENSELNPATNLHGKINSRVFIVRNVQSGQQLNVIEQNSGEIRECTVPDDKEYIIVSF